MGAVKTDGTMWMWGINDRGQLGHNNRVYYSSPVQLGSLTDWKMGWAGSISSGVIRTNGTLYVMGYAGEDKTLGIPATSPRSSPVQIPGTTWSEFRIYNQNTHALKTDGTLWSWGDNEMGQLGYGPAPSQTSSPKQVPGTWTYISPMSESTVGVKDDKTLYTWGANEGGELGHNITGPAPSVRKTSPQQIPGTWEAAFAGDRIMFAFQEPS